MKTGKIFIVIAVLLMSCEMHRDRKIVSEAGIPVTGTWKLLTGTLIEGEDTVTTSYSEDVSFIKIINDSHFAFLQHDLTNGKDSLSVFVAGGGPYTLRDSLYTEHLEYCSARNWEGNDFTFTVRIKNDTLTQTGIEKIEGEGIDRLNIEKYVRINP